MMEIPVRGFRRGQSTVALVDATAAEQLLRSKWHIGTDGYARRKATVAERRGGAPFYIAMHRQVLDVHRKRGAPGQPEVDHINGNRLDNRRANLRIVGRSTNNLNRRQGSGASKAVGVCLHRRSGLWRAYITIGGKQRSLGYFRTEREAANARARATA